MELPSLRLERSLLRQGHRTVAGIDEVGRGSWAGPVVAAAVVLPLQRRDICSRLAGVRDSKQLSAVQREALLSTILRYSTAVSVGWSTRRTIDAVGIAEANRRAMARAITGLRPAPHALLLDHVLLPDLDLPQLAVPKGDALSLSIAAASVIAKVFRDRFMTRCAPRFPGYGFAEHKGYGTAAHRSALDRLGPCALHRRSFAPVSACDA